MRKPPIIALDQRVTRTALDMGACCGRAPVLACNATLEIRRAGARECNADACDDHCSRCATWREYDEYGWTGSCAGCGTCNTGCGCHCRPPEPVWHVPAFDNDDDGRLVFVWGDLFARLRPGLYLAVLMVCSRPVATILIEFGERERPVSGFANARADEACTTLAVCNGQCGSVCDPTPGCDCPPAAAVYVPPYDVPVMGG